MNVAILGASAKKDRYSYRAWQSLREKGHKVFPVNPILKGIEGHAVYPSLKVLPEPIDTITVYLAPNRSEPLAQEIISAGPRRVIFNPGAENPNLTKELEDNGIMVVSACTLVMLSVGNFL